MRKYNHLFFFLCFSIFVLYGEISFAQKATVTRKEVSQPDIVLNSTPGKR